ncbi:MAG: prepilin-type N-terminal cleavage/methylation domain-containing protein, partial [Lachnospiraceae bacterium]|nr:prepilin-type N-terminal cleavage/methylation domain-containing protein [Lachnospiraceae bacterium]
MKKRSNKGFTLVELIIILVILAIISALLIPTLLGYIEQARAKKYLPNAKSCYDAAQAMF